MSHPPLGESWFLTGPTASGKTASGLALAPLLGAEIVSLDSMALYRGMDIGTDKPTPAQRALVPHALVDLLEPDEEYSLAQYVAAAHAAHAEIRGRGRQVLFVGGTPLYLKALLRGVSTGPAADWGFRTRLRDEARQHGPEFLHARLAQVDPVAAARLHPHDERRVIRALEVYELTGEPISASQHQFDQPRTADACRVFVLDWPRELLYQRIDLRVERMFATGLVAEVEGLLARGVVFSRTAASALGYREVLVHLRGEAGLAETVELVKLRTRQFAKRQLTWFRSLSECRWIPLEEPIDPAAVARRIVQEGERDRSAYGTAES